MKLFLLLLAPFLGLSAAERPNIIWITSEDNDSQWLGCYGNPQARTPHLDALAQRSSRFTSFFANSPVCATARSTILTGIYAPSQGTQHMRSRHPVPDTNRSYVSYLREAGYYCSNDFKTDYNMAISDKALWDEIGPRSHYKNRAEGQPFFAIFNMTVSHESSLFEEKITRRRAQGDLPETTRLQPSAIHLPPYLPDLPEIRSDAAIYHDTMTLLDSQIGDLLKDLADRGLADDTIIFYYSDHGGILPRGKRYLKDTGVRVPLLISVPEKWQALATAAPGSVIDEPAAFIDLAPTVLSLIGIEKPEQMQGYALAGEYPAKRESDDFIFLYADRFDSFYGMRRGLTDGRWKYIRRFTPHKPAAPYSIYQFGQAGWQAYRQAWQEGTLSKQHSRVWERDQAVEELFDTQSDRWELTNLATNPDHQERLLAMRSALSTKMAEVLDTGLIPEGSFHELAPESPLSEYALEKRELWPDLVALAVAASSRNPEHLPTYLEKLSSPNALERYWSAQGCLILGKQAAAAEEPLTQLLSDDLSSNRVAAANALYVLGKEELALEALNAELMKSKRDHRNLEVLNVFYDLGITDKISPEWMREASQRKSRRDYTPQLLEAILQERDKS